MAGGSADSPESHPLRLGPPSSPPPPPTLIHQFHPQPRLHPRHPVTTPTLPSPTLQHTPAPTPFAWISLCPIFSPIPVNDELRKIELLFHLCFLIITTFFYVYKFSHSFILHEKDRLMKSHETSTGRKSPLIVISHSKEERKKTKKSSDRIKAIPVDTNSRAVSSCQSSPAVLIFCREAVI